IQLILFFCFTLIFVAIPVTKSAITMDETKPGSSEASLHLENATPTQESPGLPRHPSSESPSNPRNWPLWKKNAQILMVAFHSMMGTFMAAGIIPAYDALAEEYGITVPQASYLTSIQILMLGLSPLIWNPITATYGRYNVSLLSVVGSMVCNIGGARCTSYGGQMATRILTAFLISPPIGIGSGVITELCEPEERGMKLGWWVLLTTIGTPVGPLIMGFVTQHIGVQWIFWIFAIVNFVQFILYLAFGDETIYHEENEVERYSTFWSKMEFRRRGTKKMSYFDILAPFSLIKSPRVPVAAFAHAVTFCYGNIALIVEMPIAFGEKFNFNAQQIGLQFIAIIIGCVLGEQVSGPGSDWFLRRVRQRKGYSRPADRLWLTYIAFSTVIAGLLTWGFQLQHATKWNVTPCVGAAIASFGCQSLTTLLTTFAVESENDRASEVGVFVNFFRQIYGFLGPFYFPDMFAALGLGGAAGVMVAIIAGASLLPVIALQLALTRADKKDRH
ncbi:hypothetical protein N7456_012507, partial [Penicillium angulare]